MDTTEDRSAPDAGAGAVARASFGRLRFVSKLGYATGSAVDGIATQAVNIFLFFYATTVCGMAPALAGIALAVGLAVDAVVDPLIGSASDGCRSSLGRRIPFMLCGLPGIVIFLVLIFSLPVGLGATAMFAWLALLSIGLRTSISLFTLPYNAVGAELSDDYVERSSIAAWRWGFAMVGALAAVLFGFGVFLAGPEGLAHRAGYLPFALTLAGLAAASALVSIRTLLTLRGRLHAPTPTDGQTNGRLLREVSEIFGNQSFRTLFAGTLLLFTALAIHSTLGLHANTYFWHLAPAQIQVVTLSLFGGLLFGAPLAGPLLRRVEKRSVLLMGTLGLGVAFSTPTLLKLAGLLPFQGAKLVGFLGAVIFVGGIMMATAAIAFTSMMADASDEHEHLFGARREGLYFAGWAFAGKAAAGGGSLIAGVALQMVGFHGGPSGASHAAAGVSPATAVWMGVIYGPGSGLLAILAAAVCLLYRLDAAKHGAILSDLRKRRLSASVPL